MSDITFKQAIECWLAAEQDTSPYRYTDAELSALIGLPPETWPTAALVAINWDLTVAGQCHTIDPPEPRVLQPIECEPQILVLGKTTFAECDPLMLPEFRREADQLWTELDSRKLARAIAHIGHGWPLSPVHLGAHEFGGLFLGGGNHRYEVVKYAGIPEFYFLADEEDVAAIDIQLRVVWLTPPDQSDEPAGFRAVTEGK
ncbi:hypothetical protein [Pectobacterium odoriferum]|uniref:hypothetical protein n=1 Tax=Pectobacterium odoriferum TaxID=78398 RepID=UPI000CD1438C|nr:hypothetical protein [Pectobacterium odoriferum]POE02686.1 hypothetical protein BVY05_07705 [Pectobacterium odoriferum]